MNLFEIYRIIIEMPQIGLDTVICVNNMIPAGLVCSMTISSSILALILFGAIRLVVPYEPKNIHDSDGNIADRH